MDKLLMKLSRAPRGRTGTLRLAMRCNSGNPHKERKAGSRNRNRLMGGPPTSSISEVGLPPLMIGLYAKVGILPGVGEFLRKGSRPMRSQAEVDAALAAVEVVN